MYGRRSHTAFSVPVSMTVVVVMVSGVRARQQPGPPVQSTATQRVSPRERASTMPLPGRVVVDADHPQWLKRHGGGAFFMCGPGDPEGFLYRGTRNPDGTRSGDQMALIEKLNGTGANCIYLMAVRSHGGDGDSTHNPFVDSDPTKGLDQDILNQWEAWFAEMDSHGIVVFFFLYDDSARIWNTGDTVGAEERSFLHGLVDRFERHRHLIWCVAEEYEERYSAARVSRIAAEIRAADDYDHAIAVHKLNGLSFSEFADDPYIDQFAAQYNVDTAGALHNGVVSAFSAAAGRYNLNLAEAANYGSGAVARQKSWAIAMGGAYVMILGMDIAGTEVSDLEDCGRLVRFFESTDFHHMAPHDQLAFGGTEYVLARPGDSYIAYASNLSGQMGLRQMAQGFYDFKWYDVTTGAEVRQRGVAVLAGDRTWSKPPGIGSELALYVKRCGDLDVDADVDLDDYTLFAAAINGPNQPALDPRADLDGGDDCDLGDFVIFAANFTGAQ